VPAGQLTAAPKLPIACVLTFGETKREQLLGKLWSFCTVTAPVQELPLGVLTAVAPTSDTYAELLSLAVIAEGAVKLTTIGAEFV
jgi:hypothetical protein